MHMYNRVSVRVIERMLKATHLTCERDHRVLFEDLSFDVAAGSALLVTGPNGAGKSTLLRILAGLYEDFDGTIDWQINDYPLYVGHRHGVKDGMTARENLRWAATLYDQDVSEAALLDALSQVSLRGYEDVVCGAMSEGQRKRVNLARLFVLDNPVWILDEPLSSIDTAGVSRLEARFDAHVAAGGVFIATSHQPLSLTSTAPGILALGHQEGTGSSAP
jgi:heme exporter protein A